MQTRSDGGPAFPCDGIAREDGSIARSSGVTVRDYFAAKAMQAILTGMISRGDNPSDATQVATAAYKMADAMLAERAK